MCGIIHCKSIEQGKKVNKTVLKRYRAQQSRGKEGFGFIEVYNGVIGGIKRAETEKEILELLEKSDADEILFHHRFPTSTPNFIESTHPIYVSHESLEFDYYVVHNGVITNDDTLRDAHIVQGFVYTTECEKQYVTKGQLYTYGVQFNDSEALAIDFALSVEKNLPIKASGSIALVAYQVKKTTQEIVALYWGRNRGNPLKLEEYNTFFALSSETGKEIPVNALYRMEYETFAVSKEDKDIGFCYTYPRSEYAHTTLGFGQPDRPALPAHVTIITDDEDETDSPARREKGLEEDDYILDMEIEAEQLQKELKDAYGVNDFDTAYDLEVRLEEIMVDIGYKKSEWLTQDNG